MRRDFQPGSLAESGATTHVRSQGRAAFPLLRAKPCVSLFSLMLGLLALQGCHASPDDAAGQAKELEDPVRRQNALYNLRTLYSKASSSAKGTDAKKALTDTVIGPLVKVYVDHPEDNQNGMVALNLLGEMHDARALPAFLKALDWRPEVSEEHAVRAAEAIAGLQIPPGEKAKTIAALDQAYGKISGARPIDGRMREAIINALGSIPDPGSAQVLAKIAISTEGNQSFDKNRLAAFRLGAMADSSAIPSMIHALFLADPNNPGLRMSDVAAGVLVAIGRPALAPVLKVQSGQDAQANAWAKALVDQVKRKSKGAGDLDPREITATEGSFVLGMLGFPEALEPLLKESKEKNWSRRVAAAFALARLNVDAKELIKIRDAMRAVYKDASVELRPRLLGAMRQLYDPAVMSVFLDEAKGGEKVHPVVRLEAVASYALLANKQEAEQLRAFIRTEPPSEEGGYREKFSENEPLLKAADRCNEDLGCWERLVSSGDNAARRKAAFMLGRYGRGRASSLQALTKTLDHPSIEVRMAGLLALDRAAVKGSPEAVAKIDELKKKEAGKAIWSKFESEALPVQARLRARAK